VTKTITKAAPKATKTNTKIPKNAPMAIAKAPMKASKEAVAPKPAAKQVSKKVTAPREVYGSDRGNIRKSNRAFIECARQSRDSPLACEYCGCEVGRGRKCPPRHSPRCKTIVYYVKWHHVTRRQYYLPGCTASW